MKLLTRITFILATSILLLSGVARADVPTAVKPVSMGLGGYAYWSSGPFSNTLLTGFTWLEYDTTFGDEVRFYEVDGTANPQFDANGFPKYLTGGKKLRIVLWPYAANISDNQPAHWPERGQTGVGKWVVTWQGEADIRLNGATFLAGESSGAEMGSLVDGRRVYSVSAASATWAGHLRIEAINAADPITDLKVWLPDPSDPQNKSLENSGSMWHPDFLGTIQGADFNHLRFMDWGYTNQSPQQDWADRRIPGFALQAGVLNRRSPAEGVVHWTDTSTDPDTVYYFDGDRETGIAYEHMINLCNETSTDMWVCVPHLATDTYVTNLANLIAFGSDGVNAYTSTQESPVYPPLDSSLKVWVEYSNEIWSNGNAFPQGNWAQAQGDAIGITKAQFNARRYSEIWSIFQECFGDSSRIVRSAAIWTARDIYTNDFFNELKVYGATLNPAVSPDVIAPTTYFGNGIQDWAYEQANLTRGTTEQWFHTSDDANEAGTLRPVSVPLDDPYWESAELSAQQDATFIEWKKRIFSGSTASGGGPDSTGTGGGFGASLHDDIFTAFGVHLPIVAYEGGPSLYTDYMDGSGFKDDGVTNFFIDLNRKAQFAEIYRIQLNMARAKGLNGHSLFVDISRWGKYGQWGHLEYQGQPLADSVKWTAVQDWASAMVNIRSIDAPLGSRPTFVTAGTLPIGIYQSAYSQDIVVSDGDLSGGNSLQFTVVGSLVDSQLALAPVAGDPRRFRVSGTPQSGGWNYIYLRVSDDDGDAAWQIYSFYIAGGADTLLELDSRGDFEATTSLPWANTHVIESAVTWSGMGVGAAFALGGGSAQSGGGYTDGTGVQVFDETGVDATDGFKFSVDQGGEFESDSTLASAITDHEYWTFTVTPNDGVALDLSDAEMRFSWNREQYHSPRNFVVMTSVEGFAEGQQVYTLSTTPEWGALTEHIFKLPNTAGYTNLTGAIEFRIYFYGSQFAHSARIMGLKLTTASVVITPPLDDGTAKTIVDIDTSGTFDGANSLPWIPVLALDSDVTWSGMDIGVDHEQSGGSGVGSDGPGTDGIGVSLKAATDGLLFSLSQSVDSMADATLASAITDNEYWKFTVTPGAGTPLNLRDAEMRFHWMRDDYHSARYFAVMSSVDGFTEAQAFFTMTDVPDWGINSEHVFKLPDTAAYSNLTTPVEFRIYFYGSQHAWHYARILGLKLTTTGTVPLAPYAAWTTAVNWNGADSTAAADPNADGVTNLLAYGLDIDPLTVPEPIDLPAIATDSLTAGGPWITLTFRKNQSATDIVYTVLSSSTLAADSWTDLVVDDVTVFEDSVDADPDGDGSSELIRIRTLYDSEAEPRRFLRLEVSESL